MDGFFREDLLDRLSRLDEDADLLFDDDRRFRMVIVGGSALILLEIITRATHDIDALDVSPEIVNLLEKYDINTRVSAFINNFPYNYEERLVPVRLNGRRIDFYTASLEDIVIAKLYSGRATDVQDIIDPRVLREIDWDRLEALATSEDEAKASALNEYRYKEFLDSYHTYVGRWKNCGNSLSKASSPGM
ncbi:MAG: hypothetical protein HUJ65_07310 [Oscillospiraceae bacterium]|nr:hypothetical protein [Oscillospiraceae bacterium]